MSNSTYAVYNGVTKGSAKLAGRVAVIVEARDKRAAERAGRRELKARADENKLLDESYFADLTVEKLDLPVVLALSQV